MRPTLKRRRLTLAAAAASPGMRAWLRHHLTEALFVFPTFLVALVVVWCAKRFAWSDATTSAANLIWIIGWGGMVLLRGDQVIRGVSEFLFQRGRNHGRSLR